MDYKFLETEIEFVLNAYRNNLDKSDVVNIEEFLNHGEYGLAFELLCACLKSKKVNLTHMAFEKLKVLAEKMRLQESEDWCSFKSSSNR